MADNANVSRIVNRELSLVNRNPAFTSVSGALGAAWRTVNRRRLDGDCGEDLGIAEHYLYARWLISQYGPPMMGIVIGLSTIYDISKLAGIPIQEGNCPQIPVSEIDCNWKVAGANDGMFDFARQTTLGQLSAPNVTFQYGIIPNVR